MEPRRNEVDDGNFRSLLGFVAVHFLLLFDMDFAVRLRWTLQGNILPSLLAPAQKVGREM